MAWNISVSALEGLQFITVPIFTKHYGNVYGSPNYIIVTDVMV